MIFRGDFPEIIVLRALLLAPLGLTGPLMGPPEPQPARHCRCPGSSLASAGFGAGFSAGFLPRFLGFLGFLGFLDFDLAGFLI